MIIKFFGRIIPFILAVFIINSCGEGMVEVGSETYEPLLVIEGYIYPGRKVENIRVTKNIPIGAAPNLSVVLSNADVKIYDLSNGKEFKLVYNNSKYSFEYNGDDLKIDYGNTYKIIIAAEVNGKTLSASSQTTVPQKGFQILEDESYLGAMKYREKNHSGEVKSFKVAFKPSPGTSYYPISIVAMDASTENFIFDNAYFEVELDDLKDEFDRFKYQFKAVQNVKYDAVKLFYDVEWLDTWFYGKYRLIIYAADENFRLFAQTHKNVQEFDGNFHEPRFNIQGDGIGVFGSAISDTVYFEVLK